MSDPFSALRPLLPLTASTGHTIGTHKVFLLSASGDLLTGIIMAPQGYAGSEAITRALAHVANCHDELTEALRNIVAAHDAYLTDCPQAESDPLTEACEAGRAALAKALGSDPHGDMLSAATADSETTP